MQNWARWRPSSPEEIIGSEAKSVYDQIKHQVEDDAGERCFLIHGAEGRGKTTIATFIGSDYADSDMNLVTLKGNKVTGQVVDDLMHEGHSKPLFGDRRALIINEVDNINKNIQDTLHDWLQDELPDNYVVIATTNKAPCVRADYEKMTAEQKAEHLTPKFSSRFTQYTAPTLEPKELAKNIYRMCLSPIKDRGVKTKIALECANKSKGDIRQALKLAQAEFTKYKIERNSNASRR